MLGRPHGRGVQVAPCRRSAQNNPQPKRLHGRPQEGADRAQPRPRAGRGVGGRRRWRSPGSAAALMTASANGSRRISRTSATRRCAPSRPASSTALVLQRRRPHRACWSDRSRCATMVAGVGDARLPGRLVVRAGGAAVELVAAEPGQRHQAVRLDAVGRRHAQDARHRRRRSRTSRGCVVRRADRARRRGWRGCRPSAPPALGWRHAETLLWRVGVGARRCWRSATTAAALPPDVVAEDDASRKSRTKPSRTKATPRSRGASAGCSARWRAAGCCSDVERATVVITNPTHFAVALEYRRETMAAPLVLAKGAGPHRRCASAKGAQARRADRREQAARAGALQAGRSRRGHSGAALRARSPKCCAYLGSRHQAV